MVQLYPVKVRLNDIDGMLYAEKGMEGVLTMHILDIAELLHQKIENRMVLRNYLLLEVLDEKDNIIGSTTWVPPIAYTMESRADGYIRPLNIPYFTQITEVTPGIEGKELTPIDPFAPVNREIYMDVNNRGFDTINVLGVITHTPDKFDWGFNGGNGIMNFVNMMKKYVMDADSERPRLIMYHDRFIGYHFEPASEETILKYYKIKE